MCFTYPCSVLHPPHAHSWSIERQIHDWTTYIYDHSWAWFTLHSLTLSELVSYFCFVFSSHCSLEACLIEEKHGKLKLDFKTISPSTHIVSEWLNERVWVHEWVVEWASECTSEWLSERVWVHEWVVEWASMSAWVSGWVSEYEYMSEWLSEWVRVHEWVGEWVY